MQSRQIVSAILKLWVLAMIAGALYFLWQERTAPPLASDVEAAEEVKATNVEVRIGTIQKMTLHNVIVGYGNVEPEPATAQSPAADAKITIDWPAVVSEVSCIEGQHVAKGDTLFTYKGFPVVSPIAGTVVAVNIHPGEVALPTRTAVEIVDLDRLVVAANVPAWEVGKIKPDQSAQIAAHGNDEPKAWDSKIERIDSAADPQNSLVNVDITVPPNQNFRPGEFARVNIVGQENPNALVVPADAVVRDSQDVPYIGIVSDDRKEAILKPVEIGLREGDWVQVTADGLAADQTIVTGGAYGLLFKSGITVLNP
jgi:multidrug efflux pump subunit AcrA (membrane-fusion protein)